MGPALGQNGTRRLPRLTGLTPLTGLLAAMACGLVSLPARPDEPAAAAKPSTAQPNVHVLPTPFVIPGLNRERTVRVYLPPGYEWSTRRYPVLYMHDGQNLFDDATSYAGEWGIDETLNELARTRGLELIVIGIDNGGAERIHELNPFDNPEFGKGEGAEYTAFIALVLKPWIDQHYRTQPGRRHTAIMGSSMGGLISGYAIGQYPHVFGKAGIFSPAYWLAPQVFADTEAHPPPRDARMYFYAGGSESLGMVPDMKRMVALLEHAGLPDANLEMQVNPVGRHHESAWRAAFPRAILWLYRERLKRGAHGSRPLHALNHPPQPTRSSGQWTQ
jgi:predicted alpha/beta superfamily hydrolase